MPLRMRPPHRHKSLQRRGRRRRCTSRSHATCYDHVKRETGTISSTWRAKPHLHAEVASGQRDWPCTTAVRFCAGERSRGWNHRVAQPGSIHNRIPLRNIAAPHFERVLGGHEAAHNVGDGVRPSAHKHRHGSCRARRPGSRSALRSSALMPQKRILHSFFVGGQTATHGRSANALTWSSLWHGNHAGCRQVESPLLQPCPRVRALRRGRCTRVVSLRVFRT
jgi:hypothetical protein